MNQSCNLKESYLKRKENQLNEVILLTLITSSFGRLLHLKCLGLLVADKFVWIAAIKH